MKFKPLILIILISFVLIFAGCSKKQDCSTLDTTYEKYKLNTETDECQIFKTIKEDVCGNGVLEKDETYCNCPKDVKKANPVLGCSGTTGEYLEKSCSEKTKDCILSQNDKVIEKTKSVEFKNSDLTLQGNFILNTPFILELEEENKIKTKISLYKTQTSKINIKNILVKKVRILNSKADVLATVEYNEGLGNLGDSLRDKEIVLAQITQYLKVDYLKLELEVTYTKEFLNSKGEITKTENKIETLKSTLGKWTLINPNFFDEVKDSYKK